MASEIRVNRLSNRSGLSTITFANGGVQFSGITTFANGDFRVGTGATILNPSTNEMQFHTGGSSRLTINNSGATIAALTATTGTFSGDVSIGGVLTYEDVKNVDAIGIVTARTGVKVTGGDFTVGTAITASSVTGNVTQDVGITTFSGSSVWFKGATANKDMYWSHASGATVYKDNAQILMGNSSDLQIYHNTSNSIIKDAGTGVLSLQSNGTGINMLRSNGDVIAQFFTGGSVELYHNNILKLATDLDGIRIGSGGGDNTIVDLHNASYDNGVIQYYNGSINLKTGSSNGDRQISLSTAGSERLRITSAGLVEINGFNGIGLRLKGSGGDYQGVQLQTTDSSASQTRNIFIDVVNETGAAIANQIGSVQSDGGSHWSWQTQPPGNRTDRRVERLRIQSDGIVRFYNSIYGADNKPIYLGNANDLSLFHDSSGASIIRYNHSVGGLHFRNNSNADQMIIDANGDLGLGIAAVPQDSGAKTLHIHHPDTSGSTARAGLRLTTGISGSAASNGGFLGLDYSNNLYLYNQENGSLRIGTNGTERLRITSGGYVGINQTNPVRPLHITGNDGGSGATSGNSDTTIIVDNAGTNGSMIEFLNANNGAGHLMFTDTDGSNRGRISYHHNGDYFRVDTSGSEKVRIASDGSFMVGTTSPNSSTQSKGISLNNDGAMVSRRDGVMHYYKSISTGGYYALQFLSANTGVGSIFFNSGGTQFNTSSDYRRKENVVSLTNGISKLKQLKPYRFNFKDNPSETVDGFLAHEAQEIVPHTVTGTKDQIATAEDVSKGNSQQIGDPLYQQMDLSKLVPLLTAALQEAIAEIETLKTKVAALGGS